MGVQIRNSCDNAKREPVHTSDDGPDCLVVRLEISDAELIDELSRYPSGDIRDEFAVTALRIGIQALKHARGRIDSDAVRNECDRMLLGMESKLREHGQLLSDHLGRSLKEYFDPESGRLPERISRLIQKDGELESLLRRQIGAEDSELCKTLAKHVGDQSQLMRILDPRQSDGLLHALSETFNHDLEIQRERLFKEFSLDNKEGSLSRLVVELTNNHGQASEKLQQKINAVVKEFDLNNADSALNRLVANVERAQRTITGEFSLDNDESALCRMKRELAEILRRQTEDYTKFQLDVREALAALSARRAEAERSTRHGLEFENAVWLFVQSESQRCGDLSESTGATYGLIKNCRIGDAVVELGPDLAAAGARIVIEVKEKVKYTLTDARQEIEQARRNRGANVGLFVFSRKTAPEGLEPFQRIGCDVFVIWDADDAQSDVHLKAGLSVARALCRPEPGTPSVNDVDWEALEKLVIEIQDRSNSLEQVHASAETIHKQADNIIDRVRIVRKSLERQVRLLDEQILGLKEKFGVDSATRDGAE